MSKILTLILILSSVKVFSQKTTISNLSNKSKFNPYSFCEHIEEGSCNQKVEKELINFYPKILKRINEHTLSFRLESGGNEILKDIIRNGEVETYYRALNYIPEIKLLVIYIQHYEGSEYLLVDQINGNSFHSIGMPVIAPDNKNIICINSDLAAEYSPNGIQVWNYNKGYLKKAYQLITKRWGPKSVSWLSESKVKIERETFDMNNYKTTVIKPVTLTYIGGKWILGQ